MLVRTHFGGITELIPLPEATKELLTKYGDNPPPLHASEWDGFARLPNHVEPIEHAVVLHLHTASTLLNENILRTAMSLRQAREYSQGIVRTLSRCSKERSAALTGAR